MPAAKEDRQPERRRQSMWLGAPWWALLTPPVLLVALVVALIIHYA